MSRLVWGILGVALGALFLLAAALGARSSRTTAIYGAVFLGYGVYRLRQYRSERAGAARLPEEKPLEK